KLPPRGLNAVFAFGRADPDINAFFPDLKTLPFFSEAAKSAPKERPPTVEPKDKPHRANYGENFGLNPTNAGTVYGHVHLCDRNREALWEDELFFVVWTDARGYSGVRGIQYEGAGVNCLYHGSLTLRYGGKLNDFDRAIDASFHIKVL